MGKTCTGLPAIRSTSIAFICAFATACSPQVNDAKTVVKEQLVDGQSARFENVVAQKTELVNGTIQSAETPAVCGWVNSKNRMGGYAGTQRFIVKAGVPTFGDASNSEWSGAFITCVVHSDDKAANDRLTREGDRALDAYEDAVNELNPAPN